MIHSEQMEEDDSCWTSHLPSPKWLEIESVCKCDAVGLVGTIQCKPLEPNVAVTAINSVIKN